MNKLQLFLDAMETLTRREEQEKQDQEWWQSLDADDEWIKSNLGEDSGHDAIQSK